MVKLQRSDKALRMGARLLALCAWCALATACGDDTATDTAASPDGGADAAADAAPPPAQGRDPRARLRGRRRRRRPRLPAAHRLPRATSRRSPPSRSTRRIPGARSVKVVLDQLRRRRALLPEQQKYQIHYEFASAHLSGDGQPIVPSLAEFNRTEYYSPDRRFLLGAVTYYEGPDVWALEIAPYDTACAEMIEQALRGGRAARRTSARRWRFHPTSEAVETEATTLPTTSRSIDAPTSSTRTSTTSRSTSARRSAGCAS